MEANNISSKHMKKQILLLTAAFFFTFVLCGVASAADPSCDLTITTTANPIPPSQVYAGQTNRIWVNTIKNNGPDPSPVTTVSLYASDVNSGTTPVATANVPSLASGQTVRNLTGQDIYLIDPTIRPVTADTVYGSSSVKTVQYTTRIDPDNNVIETNESNNEKKSAVKPVYYNGYAGKWNEWINGGIGGNITTKHTYDLRGGLVYSSGDSKYRSGSFGGSGGWTTYDIHWNSTNLPIPSTGSVVDVWLFVPYTWDNSHDMPDNVTLVFNGQTIHYINWYHDQSNFGAYPDFVYGLLTYNVTSLFNANANNTVTFTRPGANDKLSMYGLTLAAIYADPNATRKQIFINEDFDILGASLNDYGSTPELATAYIPFSGMTIDIANAANAMLHSFSPSAAAVNQGDTGEGNLIVNGETIAYLVWNYGEEVTGESDSTQVAIDVRDILAYLNSTGNIIGIQATPSASPLQAASQQFLVIEYNDVIANPVGGLFSDALDVSLEAAPGDRIYYTTDGTNPTASSIEYTGPIHIAINTVLKFISVDTNGISSPVYTQNYYISPQVNSVDPVNDALINIKNKVIKITFNEDIQAGSAYDNITVTGPSGLINFTKSISGKVLSLTPVANLADGNYTLNIPINSISNMANYGLAFAFTSNFTLETIAPIITSVDPTDGSTKVAANKTIKVTFNENIKKSSDFWVELKNGSNVIDTTNSVNGNVLTIDPKSNLAEAQYTLVIHTGAVTDLAGNPIAYTTSKFIVGTPPTVVSVDPTNNKVINVANKALIITFSENIKEGSAFSNIKVTNPDGVSVNPLYKVINGKTLTLTRNGNYINGLTYTITLPTGSITDTAGNAITAFTSKFTVDFAKPTITSVNPANNKVINVANKALVITFSEAIKAGSAFTSIKVTNPDGVKVNPLYKVINGKTLTLTRNGNYINGLTYTITLPTGSITDTAGNTINTYTSKFKIDTTKPTITRVNPANNKIINLTNKAIVITFSENIKAGSAFTSIKVTNPDGVKVKPLYKVINGKTLTLTRNGNYINGLTYTITLPTGSITDTAGNTLKTTFTSKFKIDTTKPTITRVNPANNKIINIANKAIVITFSENIKAGSAFTSIKVTNPDGVKVKPLYKVINGKTLTLTRNGNYINRQTYTITLPTGSITDTAGNTLKTTFTSKFKIDTTKPP